MTVFDTLKYQLQRINWLKPAFIQNWRTGISISEDDLELKCLCSLEIPQDDAGI